ncbi:unnamed protein product [Ceutorhynchus assimilis]|uniref:AAA+ ATPase domain-containing protein n=1 Tax=Ceutorhynchus assimilis TaxID=467358 RepID=A0A9N9MKI5_9CUCU|nr:unnamed protein product [Ceutorhynchus assimilis]
MANINLTLKHRSKQIPNRLDKIKIEARERRRNILHLILAYLNENMLNETAECLSREAQLDSGYELCENVELEIILQEYQSYYYAKFQKYPKIVRKLNEEEIKIKTPTRTRARSAKRIENLAPNNEKQETPSESEPDFHFQITHLGTTKNDATATTKPLLPEWDQCTDNGDLIKQVSDQVIVEETGVKWTDCVGLDNAIEILKESTIYPLYYPEIFKNIFPWKGVLLHGPPGTGKTLLAKALASEVHTTFFNVTSSSFISKWRGESEKLIKNLFDVAKNHAPSTIFFDEIDALISRTTDIQHEASKRFKSELLVQLDGISSSSNQIFILASTNSPWDLDDALLRRFDKRILVDMPAKEARIDILRHHLKNSDVALSLEDFKQFGDFSVHYSGSDIKNVTKEVAMAIVREKIKFLEKGGKEVSNRSVIFDDIKRALQKIKPATNEFICKKYYQWQNKYGAL